MKHRTTALRLLWLSALVLLLPPAPVRAQTPSPNPTLTWSHDIAPLLYDHCTTCHHPGGAGPFSLLTYADAHRWGPQVQQVTQSRYMPPWLPEPNHGDFADVRRLPDTDLAKIKAWVAAGMPEGDPALPPSAPHYDATWQLGPPDLILKTAQPFTLPAGGTDVFLNLVLPTGLKQTHFIRAMEIRPGAPQVVHHANVLIDRTASFRRQHLADWQLGIPGMEILLDAGNTFDPDSHFLFWKPDTPALIEPPGMPWRLDPGNDLILNIHLKPSGKPEQVVAQIGLYFTDQPPTQHPMLLQLDRDDALDIPAGANAFTVGDTLTLPTAVDVLGIYPHAHYLGKDMQGWAEIPPRPAQPGSPAKPAHKEWLVWIKDWDIDRQSVYRYRQPLRLPKGTVLHMRYTYDNSTANPRNPHTPPVRVRAGNRSEDEMSHMWLQVLSVEPTPAPNASTPDPRLLLEEAWMRNRLRKTPADRISLYNLAAALAGQGKFPEAVVQFQHALKLAPNDPSTLTALGAALDGAGDWQAARTTLQQAIASSNSAPAQACDARYDLAALDLHHEQFDSAAEEFRTQLATCLEDAETHEHLAQALGATNHTKDAIAHLRQAIQLSPNVAEYHALLSQALDATNQNAEALTEAQSAATLAPNDPDLWNNLGVQQARAHDPTAARSSFQHALQLDPSHQQAKANLARLN